MEKIKNVIRNTGKKCSASNCTGNIVEMFMTKYGEWDGIVGGSRRPSWPAESTGFGCDVCGQTYGQPVFKKTHPSEQVKFELELYVGKLTKKISAVDLMPFTIMKPGKKVVIKAGNKSFNATTLKETTAKANLPLELKNIRAGTKVFILPSDSDDIHDIYHTVQLSKTKGSKTFQIKKSCIK